MASGGVNANINIRVKNLEALNRVNKNLEAINKTNNALIDGLSKVERRLNAIDSKGLTKLDTRLSSLKRKFDAIDKGFSGKGIQNTYRNIQRSAEGAADSVVRGLSRTGITAFGLELGRVGSQIGLFGGALKGLSVEAALLSALFMGFGPQAFGALTGITQGAVKGVAAFGKLGQAVKKNAENFALAKTAAIDFNIGIINVKKQMENMVRGGSLKEIRTLVNQSKDEMEGFWSMTRGAEQAAIKLAAALKAQSKEQRAITDLLLKAQGKASTGEQADNARALNAFKAKTIKKDKQALDIATRRNKLWNQYANGYYRLVEVGGEMLNIEQRIEKVQDRKRRKQQKAEARRAGRGRMGENLMLGAGFPMLFGGGAGAVGGGVLGAGIQGLSGGKGFGAQILLSAIGQKVDEFVGSVSKLGQALNSATPDVNALVAALGITGTEFKKNLDTLIKLGGEEAAFEATRRRMVNLVGSEGVEALKRFGEGTTKLANEFTKAMTQMRASFAKGFGQTGIGQAVTGQLEKANLFRQAQKSDNPEMKALMEERKNSMKFWGWQNKERRTANEVMAEIVAKQRELNKLADTKALEQVKRDIQKARVEDMVKEIAFLEKNMHLTEKEFAIEVKLRELNKEGEISNMNELRNSLKKIQLLKEERKEVLEIKEAWKGINQSIRDDITQGIKGLIKGTATWADMLNNIADKFLDMAINQAFYGNIMGEMGKGSGGLFKFFGFANGGRPPVGKPSIVGEKGPELFVPSSSGRIVPNHELGKGGGSTSVVVNVDASGTEVQGDDAQAKQLGTMLSAAVQAELVKQKRPGGLLAGV